MLEKFKKLRQVVRAQHSALVCFSGGVDSTLLLKVAADELGDHCYAITAESATLARSEREDARRLGAELGLGDRHIVVESNELERPGFAQNPIDRCYLCKAELFDLAKPLGQTLGVSAVMLGTNLDDLGDHRPGLAAANERGAVHPLVEAGLTKSDVRALSRELGLRTWDKPQLACLSSRFPYGTEITPERLARVDAFEDGLRAMGFGQLRVRFHGEMARLELDKSELLRALQEETRQAIDALGLRLNFREVTVDKKGYRTGSLNENLVTLRTRLSPPKDTGGVRR